MTEQAKPGKPLKELRELAGMDRRELVEALDDVLTGGGLTGGR